MSEWKIQRAKLKITHPSYSTRNLEWELAIKNQGDETQDFVMVIPKYLPGLSITDGEGRNLGFLPTAQVEDLLGDRQEFIRDFVGAEAYQKGDYSGARILWIVFPRGIGNGEYVTVRLHFEDSLNFSEGLGLVRRPRYPVEEKKSHEDYDTFIEIRVGSEGRLFLKPLLGLPEKMGEKGASGSVHNQWPRFLQVRAPAHTTGVKFRYYLQPRMQEVLLAHSFYTLLFMIPFILLLFAGLAKNGITEFPLGQTSAVVPQSSGTFIQNVSLFGATVSLVAMGLLPPAQLNRMWYLIPFSLYLMLLIWGNP